MLLALLVTLFLPAAHAAPPELMTYQGFLVDANGNALATSAPANYPVVFRIFDSATAGSVSNRKWSEQQIVTVDKGSFSVQLGEGTAVAGEVRPNLSTVFSGANSAERYMELTVTISAGNNVTLLPRLRLLPAPYAFAATSASSLVTASGTSLVTASGVDGITVAGKITGDGSGLTGLDASKIATGTLNLSRIPSLPANQITSGALDIARIPALSFNLITGTLTSNQIPVNLASHNFSGSVGIGTNAPDATLDVRGTVKMLGKLSSLSQNDPWRPTASGQFKTNTVTTDGFLTVVITQVGITGNIIARVRGTVDDALCGAASCNVVAGEDWPIWENSFMMPVPKGSTWRVTYNEEPNTSHAYVYIKWTPLGR